VDEAAAKLKMEITSKPLALDEVGGWWMVLVEGFVAGGGNCCRLAHLLLACCSHPNRTPSPP
jgi:hypothetical protein